MSFAVLGTDTDVGKTVACAALLLRLSGRCGRWGYWKPIASGARRAPDGSGGRDAETVAALLADAAPGAIDILPETYLFEAPLSPHLAARLEGRTVDPARVLRDFARHRASAPRSLVVEGVGGLLVPLDENGSLLADLIGAMALPSVVVARSTLGTINHTLLTLEAARARGLRVVGVILNGPPNLENRRAIERFGGVAVLGELPWLDALSRSALAAAAAALDPDDVLVGQLAEETAGDGARFH